MADRIPWFKTLGARLGAIIVLLVLATATLLAGNIYLLSEIRGDAAALNYLGRGPTRAMEMIYLAFRLPDESGERKTKLLSDLREAMTITDQRAEELIAGVPSLGITPQSDARIISELQTRDRIWDTEVRPVLERIIDAQTPEQARSLYFSLQGAMDRFRSDLDTVVSAYQRVAEEKVDDFRSLQYAFALVVIVVLSLTIWITRGVASRVRSLSRSAERIGGGDLTIQADIEGSDEITALAGAFNGMTTSLRDMIEAEQKGRARLEQLIAAIRDSVAHLASASAEILAGTTQQAAGAQEQAAAVSETGSTVGEVMQTSEQAAQRAKAVADSAQRAAEFGRSGRQAVEDTVAAMATVSDQTGAVAENILALAEQAQAIGEIIATVNDIAEQTNLLALNAGIEASRAGEHGAGFTVVAREIKDLADQAKKATAQVRQILGEIQKATNSAVMVTEEGSKSVNAALAAVNRTGETIKTLADTVEEAARMAAQIAASAGQQATGMAQIQQAMKDINQTTNQNLASTRQAERAAQDLNELGTRLKAMVEA